MILQYNNKHIFGLCLELLEQRSEVLWLETIYRNSDNGDFKLFKEIRLLVYNMEITFNYNKMSLIKTCLLIYILKKYSTDCSLIKIRFQTPLICCLFFLSYLGLEREHCITQMGKKCYTPCKSNFSHYKFRWKCHKEASGLL